MIEKIKSLENKTIYQIIGLLGIFIPLSFIIFGNEVGRNVLMWICGMYILVMFAVFILRTKEKKNTDIPSLIGILIPGLLFSLILIDVI